VPVRGQIARVAVDDEVWLTFRQAALAQGVSVSAYLGRLVEREVRRRGGQAVGEVAADAPDRDQALAALAEVRAAIDELDAIAGRLARSAIAHGGTWEDVAGPLRIDGKAARAAYDK
jgi:hypothetical protein